MKNKISAIIIVHNEDAIIAEALESVKNAVDEIVVVHDGACEDKTVDIAKRYTKKVIITPHKGRSAFNVITALKKATGNWILKLDADESLSPRLQKNLRTLVKEKNIDAFSFIHPLWDGKKPITKTWPRKTVLVRKKKITYLAFPGFDMSVPTSGVIKKTDYVILHKPLKNQDVGWQGFREKVLKRYAPSQAKFLLKPFSEFETYQYPHNQFPLKVRVRITSPLITNAIYAMLVFCKQLFVEGAYKEGANGFHVALKTFIYNCYLGYLIQKEKWKSSK